MLLSLNWLKDFVDLPRSVNPEELANKLTLHTVEVDGIEKQSDKYRGVVVGKIIGVKKHPNADRLRVVSVQVKKNDNPLQIICGASNIEAGQLVPVALPGTSLAGGILIEKAEIRGVESSGMLCAEDELGLGNDHSGILILDAKRAKIGQSFGEYFGADDVIIEVDNKSITNRPDLWSHAGVAREIAAFFGTGLKNDVYAQKVSGKEFFGKDEVKLDIKIEDAELCPRYMAVAIGGIKIASSPKWLADRLIAVGSRPINNIVDLTNFVMLELGQPLHAFDSRELDADGKGKKFTIRARRAKDGERLITLDGKERALDREMLVIANKENAIGVAGIMGGEGSGIKDDSSAVVIESANFNFISIRKTSARLGLRSEASIRFEKELDPELCAIALRRIVSLIKEICPGAETISEVFDFYPKQRKEPKRIGFDFHWLEQRVGFGIKENEVAGILDRLGFEAKKGKDGWLEFAVPSWRAGRDINLPEDLMEEVARIHGYNEIRAEMPSIKLSSPEIRIDLKIKRAIADFLAARGWSEVYNYSFLAEERLRKLGIDQKLALKLLNPLSSEENVLRKSLAPGLLANIARNQARYEEINLFEFGEIYLASAGTYQKDADSDERLPFQATWLGLVMADGGKDIFSEIKGEVGALFKKFGGEAVFSPDENPEPWAERVLTAEISLGGEKVGRVSVAGDKAAAAMKLKKRTAVAELDFSKLVEIFADAETDFHEYEKYPPLERDLAFVVEGKISYNDIKEAIFAHSPLIKRVELFDVYEGEKIGKGKRSLAFHIAYQADRTLTGEEAEKIQSGLIDKLGKDFGAKIRDF